MKKALRILTVVIGWITICNVLKVVTGHSIWWPDYWQWIWLGGNFGVFWYFGALMIVMLFLPVLSGIFHCIWLRYVVLTMLFIGAISADLFSGYRIYQGEMFCQAKIPQMFRLWTWGLYYFLGGQLAEFVQSEMFNRFRKVVPLLLLPITVGAVVWQYHLCIVRVGCVNS